MNEDELCFVNLLHMSIDIVEGMGFLSEMGIVHRDLAARNILGEIWHYK